MDIFHALAEPRRRDILQLLADKGQLPASEISRVFPISPPAISQHLKVLLEAGLVVVEKKAQQRLYQINPQKILELERWAQRVSKLWHESFDKLDVFLQNDQ